MLVEQGRVGDFLPHRHPFLFIDSVEEICFVEAKGQGEEITKEDLLGSKVIAHYKTVPDHPIFAGHFPGNPILPGVVQIEMMAQAGAFSVYPLVKDTSWDNLEVALLSSSNSKFRKPIYPNMNLVVTAVCSRYRGNLILHDSKIHCDGDLMSETSTTAMIKL